MPERVIREGKVPSAVFPGTGRSKGNVPWTGIRVADYHANLIYNEGGGTGARATPDHQHGTEIASSLKNSA